MRHSYYIIFILFLLSAVTQGQESRGLKDCIAYGLQNNRNVHICANDKKAAEAQGREALAAYLPAFNVTASLDNNLKLEESDIPAGIFGPKDIRIALTQKYNSQLLAEVDQTIYDQALLTGLKANKYNIRQADLNIQQNEETIIYNISNAYYQVYVYREQLSLLSINLRTYEQQMQLSALKVKKGVAIQSDLDKVTVNYNNTQSQISVAESNLALAENQLKNEMGYSLDSTLIIGDATPVHDPVLPNDSIALRVLYRTDYQLAKVDADLLEINQKKIRAGALPRLTAYARYGAVGFGSELSPAVNDLSPYSAVGIKLTIPLFDFYKRNAQYNQAKYKQLDALENLELDAAQFRLEYEDAKTKLTKSQKDVENNSRNIELARSVFKTTNLQYQKGVTDLTDLLNAQGSLKEAQNNYLSSLYTFYQAKIALEKSNGTLRHFYHSL